MQAYIVGGICAVIFTHIVRKVLKMFDVNALQAEVNAELAKEGRERAKKALVKVERDIANAKQIVANLERQKVDLIASIGDGTF